MFVCELWICLMLMLIICAPVSCNACLNSCNTSVQAPYSDDEKESD